MHIVISIQLIDGLQNFRKLTRIGILGLVGLVLIQHMENHRQMIFVGIHITVECRL